MNLKNILSERSQTQRATYCLNPFIHNVQNRQTTKEYTNGYQREEQKIAGNQNVPSFWDDRNVLELNSG